MQGDDDEPFEWDRTPRVDRRSVLREILATHTTFSSASLRDRRARERIVDTLLAATNLERTDTTEGDYMATAFNDLGYIESPSHRIAAMFRAIADTICPASVRNFDETISPVHPSFPYPSNYEITSFIWSSGAFEFAAFAHPTPPPANPDAGTWILAMSWCPHRVLPPPIPACARRCPRGPRQSGQPRKTTG